MAKHTLKILRCSHPKILNVCLAIFQNYEIKSFKFIILEVKFEVRCLIEFTELFLACPKSCGKFYINFA